MPSCFSCVALHSARRRYVITRFTQNDPTGCPPLPESRRTRVHCPRTEVRLSVQRNNSNTNNAEIYLHIRYYGENNVRYLKPSGRFLILSPGRASCGRLRRRRLGAPLLRRHLGHSACPCRAVLAHGRPAGALGRLWFKELPIPRFPASDTSWAAAARRAAHAARSSRDHSRSFSDACSRLPVPQAS